MILVRRPPHLPHLLLQPCVTQDVACLRCVACAVAMHNYILTCCTMYCAILVVFQLLRTAHLKRYCVHEGRFLDQGDAYLERSSVILSQTVLVVLMNRTVQVVKIYPKIHIHLLLVMQVTIFSTLQTESQYINQLYHSKYSL